MMLLVTGTGRSGTSMFIKTLAHAGITTGPMDAVFGEHNEAIRIDGMILRARGYHTWRRLDEMTELVGSAIRRIQIPALKSTVLCHTMDVWWACRQDFKVVVCHRRLDKANRSFLKAYPAGQRELRIIGYPSSIDEVPEGDWLGLAFGQLMDVILTHGIPHAFFRFPEDLAEPGASWNRMAPVLSTVIGRDRFIDAMNAVADLSQVHW